MSRYTRTMLALIVADACLILFLTFGAVFPSRIALPQYAQVMPDEFYDFSAKTSPFDVRREPKKQAKAAIPVISARSIPVNTSYAAPQRSSYPLRASAATASQSGSTQEIEQVN